MRQSNYKNQTFSIPIEVSRQLHALVKRREMSRFVSDAILKGLEEKKRILRQAYLSANDDLGQLETQEDWNTTSLDGLE